MPDNYEKAKQTTQDRNKEILYQLASTYEEKEKKEIIRDVFVVLNVKKTVEKGKGERPLTIYEAFSYVVSCKTLGLNSMLNHLQVLEGQNYITLDGHLFNAQISGELCSNLTELIEKDLGKKYYRYKCTITRLINNREVVFSREATADPSSISRKFVTNLLAEQMAEGRATRRCLKVAFPVGIAHAEDHEVMNTTQIESQTGEKTLRSASNYYLEKAKKAENLNQIEEIKRELPPIFNQFSETEKKEISEIIKNKIVKFKENNQIKEPQKTTKKEEGKEKQIKTEITTKAQIITVIKEIPDLKLLASAIQNFEKQTKWNEEEKREIGKAFESQFNVLDQQEIAETIKKHPEISNV